MTAQEQMRAMLDQLMGTSRDGEESKFKVSFTDPKVCKSFLLSCCPHEILASTRMDLGECPKLHDLALRADYEAAAKNKEYYYDVEAVDHLQNFIDDCDRRTEQARRRLADTQEELTSEASTKANNVHDLAEQIGKKLAMAEQVGAEGNVEESLKLMQEVEDIRKKKVIAEQEYRNTMPASSYQQQKLRVCEVCSAYLGIHDNDRRLADHFGGKLHLGFISIRENLEELKKQVETKREQGIVKNSVEISKSTSQTHRRSRERDYDRNKERNSNRYNRDKDTREHRDNRRRDSRNSNHNYGSRRHRSRSRSRDKRRSRSPSHSKRSARRSSSQEKRRKRYSSEDD